MCKAEGAVLTKDQRYWLERIRSCEASGKSIAAYAAEHGFQVCAMYDAEKILVREGVLPRTHQARFQHVQLKAVTADTEWCVRLANGVSVEFSGSIDAGSLSTVLGTVAGLG
jgi:hypothetical protein